MSTSRSSRRFKEVAEAPGNSALITGATKPHHLADAFAVLEVSLTEDEMSMLERAYATAHLWFYNHGICRD